MAVSFLDGIDVSGNINATGEMECTKFIANAGSSFELT